MRKLQLGVDSNRSFQVERLEKDDPAVITRNFTPVLPDKLALAYGHDGRAEYAPPYAGPAQRSVDDAGGLIDCVTGLQRIKDGQAMALAVQTQPGSAGRQVSTNGNSDKHSP